MWPPQLPPWPSRKQLFQRSLARVISLFSFSRKNGRLWVEGGSIGWHELQHWVQNFLDDIWMILAEKNICSILATRTGTINICSENWEIGQSQVTRKLYCNGFSDTNHVEILERHPSWPTKTLFHRFCWRQFDSWLEFWAWPLRSFPTCPARDPYVVPLSARNWRHLGQILGMRCQPAKSEGHECIKTMDRPFGQGVINLWHMNLCVNLNYEGLLHEVVLPHGALAIANHLFPS